MIIKGQMTYDQHGRRRKSKFTKAVRTKQPEWKTFAPDTTFRRTTKEYPSAPLSQYSTPTDTSYSKKQVRTILCRLRITKGHIK